MLFLENNLENILSIVHIPKHIYVYTSTNMGYSVKHGYNLIFQEKDVNLNLFLSLQPTDHYTIQIKVQSRL